MTAPRNQQANHRTTNRPTQGVFWVRRIIALLVLLVVIALTVYLVQAAISFARAANDSKKRAAQTTTNQVKVSEPVECKIANLSVSATPADNTAKAGQATKIIFKMSNKDTDSPCTINGAETNVGIRISSADSTIWDSQKCAKKVKDRQLLLGTKMEYSTEFTWDGFVWDTSCNPGAKATAGTYHVRPVINGKLVGKDETLVLQ